MKRVYFRIATSGIAIWRDQRGQDFLEYALIAAVLSLTMVAFIPDTLGSAISNMFSGVVSSLQASADTGN